MSAATLRTPTIRPLVTVMATMIVLVGAFLVPGSAHAAQTSTSASAPAVVAGKSYSQRAVAKHKRASNCWTIVDGKVYKLTKYIKKHPGGRKRIKQMCGIDASAAFHSQHTGGGRPGVALRRYYIGRLK